MHAKSDLRESGLECYSYIGVPNQDEPKFNEQEAERLGLDPRIHYKDLRQGLDLTMPDGTIITHSQILEPALPSEAFTMINMPDRTYL